MITALRRRPRGSRPLIGLVSLLATLVVALVSTSGCLSNRIKVRTTDDDALVRARTLFLVVRPLSNPGGGTPAALEAEALRARLENALDEKGYASGAAGGSELVLEAAPKIEDVSRRTWTSDTDATAPKLVPATDLVFVLRAVDPDGDLTVWSSEARLPMPVNELPGLAPDYDALWNDLVERVLAKIPPSRAR